MIRELTATGVTVSVETMRASVAGAAVSEGATIMNVSGGLADPELARAVAESGVT